MKVCVIKTGKLFPGMQRGIALVVVLWVMLLLTVIASGYSISIRIETELARHAMETARARHIAEAGIAIALTELFKERDDATKKWRADGTVYVSEFDGIELRIAIEDEAGKIDLNGALPELLKGLVQTITLDEMTTHDKLADAILDWRDIDEFPRPNGAEDGDYKAAGLPYGAKDAHFENLEELLLVLGMDRTVYDQLSGAVTIFTSSQGINPAVANRQVLLALPGVDAEQVDAYIKKREQNISDGLPLPQLPVTDKRYLTSGKSLVFTVHVEARMASGVVERVAAVLMLASSTQGDERRPFEIILWQETDHFFARYDSGLADRETRISEG